MRLDPIKIVQYDPMWPVTFERERARLEVALSATLARPIEHIGSTAVPGLAAKPIVDMCAVVSEIEAVDDLVSDLERIGWVAAPEPNDVPQRRRSFCAPSVEWRTHHLHVVEESSTGWRGWLAFRDHLRGNPQDAAAYAELKRALASEAVDPNDRAGYRAGKARMIESITRSALDS